MRQYQHFGIFWLPVQLLSARSWMMTCATHLINRMVIPAGTRVTDSSNTLVWETLADHYIPAGQSSIEAEVRCQRSSALQAASTLLLISSVASVPSSMRMYILTTPGVGELAATSAISVLTYQTLNADMSYDPTEAVPQVARVMDVKIHNGGYEDE